MPLSVTQHKPQSHTQSPAQSQPAQNNRHDQGSAVSSPSDGVTMSRLHPAQQAIQLVAQSSLVSLAAVAGLRAGVVPQAELQPTLECLIKLAMGVSHGSTQQAAMIAAAALINKWPAGVYHYTCMAGF